MTIKRNERSEQKSFFAIINLGQRKSGKGLIIFVKKYEKNKPQTKTNVRQQALNRSGLRGNKLYGCEHETQTFDLLNNPERPKILYH